MERRREVQKEVKTAVSGTHIEIFAVYGIGQQQYREKGREWTSAGASQREEWVRSALVVDLERCCFVLAVAGWLTNRPHSRW